MKRHLARLAERLAELTRSELGSVAGGQELPTKYCFTGYYPSLDAPCHTVDDCFELVTIQSINSPCPTYAAGG